MQEKLKPKIGIEKEEINETGGDDKEKEQKEIEMIEKSPLFWQEKMALALAYLNEKPASWIEVSERYEQAEIEKKEGKILNQLEIEKDQVQQILDKIGLAYEMKKFKTKERTTYNSGYNFLVSKNPENLFQLKKALEGGDEKEIGLAFGCPETAVEGLASKNALYDYKKLPEKEQKRLIKEKTSKFFLFRLSKDYWQEELILVRKWQGLIKEKFPNLYKEIVKNGLDQVKEARGEKPITYKIFNRLEYIKRRFQKK